MCPSSCARVIRFLSVGTRELIMMIGWSSIHWDRPSTRGGAEVAFDNQTAC